MSTQDGKPLVIVAMGVSGTGKSTIGMLIAEAMNVDFVEGDSHHPESNIKKMSEGTPLTDEDRWPWLEDLAGVAHDEYEAGRSVVITCSALKRSYRDVLRSRVPDDRMFFLLLDADVDVLTERMQHRKKHFMPASLLKSQMETLEPLGEDETGVRVDVAPRESIVSGEALTAIEPLLSAERQPER